VERQTTVVDRLEPPQVSYRDQHLSYQSRHWVGVEVEVLTVVLAVLADVVVVLDIPMVLLA
jgi:hypothetical protein